MPRLFRVATDSNYDFEEFGWFVFFIVSVCDSLEVFSCLPRSTVLEFDSSIMCHKFLGNSSKLICCLFRNPEVWNKFRKVVEG